MSIGLHTVGSTQSYEDIPHDKKQLRFHSTQEWHDLHTDFAVQGSRKSLDFYTKDLNNG